MLADKQQINFAYCETIENDLQYWHVNLKFLLLFSVVILYLMFLQVPVEVLQFCLEDKYLF